MRGSSKKVATTASRPKLSMASLRWGTLLATTTTLTTTLDTMMKLIVLAALVSLTAAQMTSSMVNLMDTNHNGIIEKSEVGDAENWEQSACLADAIGNGDGEVQVSEFVEVMTKMTEPGFLEENMEKAAKCSGCSVSINVILFSLASLMAMIWK
jgi:hypothetical protein